MVSNCFFSPMEPMVSRTKTNVTVVRAEAQNRRPEKWVQRKIIASFLNYNSLSFSFSPLLFGATFRFLVFGPNTRNSPPRFPPPACASRTSARALRNGHSLKLYIYTSHLNTATLTTPPFSGHSESVKPLLSRMSQIMLTTK